MNSFEVQSESEWDFTSKVKKKGGGRTKKNLYYFYRMNNIDSLDIDFYVTIIRRGFMRLLGIRRKQGQGMTEYIIIVGLIALSAIIIVALFGKQIKAQFSGMTTALSGKTADVTSHEDAAKTEADSDNQLSKYDSQ